jgi:cytochrome c-type biogenesis protein CcmH
VLVARLRARAERDDGSRSAPGHSRLAIPRRPRARKIAFAALLSILWLAAPALPADPVEEQAQRLAAELRCPVCQNQSVAESPSELAQQMRALIVEQLKQGKSPEEVKAYFVSKYGDWVLLAPRASGVGLIVWVLPYIAAAGGLVAAVAMLRRWAKKAPEPAPAVAAASLERVRREVAQGVEIDTEAREEEADELLEEKRRLYRQLRELEFDYAARKLSESDYLSLRREYEAQAASLLTELEAAPRRTAPPPEAKPAGRTAAPLWRSGWGLAGGVAALLLFGVVLGVLLAQSIRPRTSEQDTITGGFLTGSESIGALLERGRQAYRRQDYAAAIDAFKKALAKDENQPEAHSYMGLILVQAGHYDGALMAFDRALASDPNFPLALWGRGMLLYRVKGDAAGGRESFEKLLRVLPSGPERDELEKTLAEMKRADRGPNAAPGGAAAEIRGTVSLDEKLRAAASPGATLFIIARPAGAPAGPPLAVKKIPAPEFPLSYTLGPGDVMIPGRSLSGAIDLSARLDQDGNPATRQPGDLSGEYKRNPVTPGAENVNIVLDRLHEPERR